MSRRLVAEVTNAALAALTTLALWVLALRVLHLSHYFAKGPDDVWVYLVTSSTAVANRSLIEHAMATTLTQAGSGYALGTLAALTFAIVFILSAEVESVLMPIALGLRSVPLVAVTPLLVMLVGQGQGATIAIAAIVTFFPSLVLFVSGMRSASAPLIDLLISYSASPWTIVRTVRLPGALPSLFAAARIAAPAAILGALLAEWLATGDGIGYLMLTSQESSQFTLTWACATVVLMVSVALYACVGAIEAVVVTRFTSATTHQ